MATTTTTTMTMAATAIVQLHDYYYDYDYDRTAVRRTAAATYIHAPKRAQIQAPPAEND